MTSTTRVPASGPARAVVHPVVDRCRRACVVLHALFALPITGACAADAAPSQRVCNGSPALCDRPLDEVVFAGAHNAMSSADDGFATPNQFLALPGLLRLGVRAFLIDTKPPDAGRPDDGVLLCHGPCALGSIPLVTELARLRAFLDEVPDTFVELVVQDDASPADTEAAFVAGGLQDALYVHDADAPWPTLGALLDQDVHVFVVAEAQAGPPDWYHPMYTSLFSDTPYAFASLDALQASSSCDVLRGDAGNPLFLVNHWIEDPFPDVTLATTANAFEVLDDRVRRCAAARNRTPHIVAVDLADVGDLMRVVDGLNGVSTTAPR